MDTESSDWVSVKEQEPEEGVLLLVCGRPFDNKGQLVAPAVYSQFRGFWGPDTLFGWIEPEKELELDSMDDLNRVTHWKPVEVGDLPDDGEEH